jgi:anti-sigma28 factor (negative regulator of flagellin synthesis)
MRNANDMDQAESAAIEVLVRSVVEERARRLKDLREAIAAGTYAVSAKALAEALIRAMRG